jgi:alkaline phosphatase
MIKLNYILTGCFLLIAVFWSCNRVEESRKPEVKNMILIVGNKTTLAGFENNKNFDELSKATRFLIAADSETRSHSQHVFPNFSAVAIGKKCTNISVGLDSAGVAHPNLIELAAVNGLATGLITSGSVVGPIPASFIAHLNNKNQLESIALEYLNSPVDFISGSGITFFNERKDGINLLQQLDNKGFSVYSDIEKVGKAKKTAILLNENDGEPQKYILQKSTVLALQLLTVNHAGFFLVIDGSDVLPQSYFSGDTGKKQETDFGHSIETAFDFASQNPGTLIIVTSDYMASNQINSIQNSESVNSSTNTTTIYTYGDSAASLSNISESTGIFEKIINHLNLDVADGNKLTKN